MSYSPLDNKNDSKYCEVLLPIPLNIKFTYAIPKQFAETIAVGSRVIVNFGNKKIHTGIITALKNEVESQYDLKEILDVLDPLPIINQKQLSFYGKLAQYYMCTEGEVLKAALPSGLKVSSDSFLQLNPEKVSEAIPEDISQEEMLIIQELNKRSLLAVHDLPKLLGKKNYLPFLRSLIKRGWVIAVEKIKDTYSPKILTLLVWNGPRKVDDLKPVFEMLSKAPQQVDLVMDILNNLRYEGGYQWDLPLDKKIFTTQYSYATIQDLVKKGILREQKKIIKRIRFDNSINAPLKKLNDVQEKCFNQIIEEFKQKNTVLLYGITGSGKTEIYLHLIKKYIDNGHQVLYLLPEIALTTQISERLAKHFGHTMAVYHSRYSDNERVEVWNSVLNQDCQLVLGVRSALFLPFVDLALIIVDEEHEMSYKQQFPNPKYHARESAILLAQLHNAKMLLGTATPSLESYWNAQSGLFGYVELNKRHAELPLPQIHLVSLKDRISNDDEQPYTKTLIQEISKCLENGEQVLLFYNRRGYAPYVQCEICTWVPHCPSCNISLTYHQYAKLLKCHICGYSTIVPQKCKTCGSSKIVTRGVGTEKIEEHIKQFFPQARVARMDLETTRKKNSLEELLLRIENNEIDILLGTQMIAKGFDFKNLKLAAVLDVEKLLFFPDFRSHERAFQLMVQLAGRTGRHGSDGVMIVQTLNLKNKLLNWVKNHDYKEFAQHEMEERKKFYYPPFSRLIQITLYHKDKETVTEASRYLYNSIFFMGEQRIKGPEFPLIDKIKNFYRKVIFVKLDKKGAICCEPAS